MAEYYQIRPEDIAETGHIHLDRLPAEMKWQDRLEAAIYYFNTRKAWGVRGVTFDNPGIMTRPVMVQDWFEFTSNSAGKDFHQKPAVYVEINNPEADAITCVAKRNNGISYANRHSFKDIHFELNEKSNIRDLIAARNASSQLYENVVVSNRGGKMQNAIHVGGYSNSAGRAVNTMFRGISIRGASHAGIFFDNCGNNHFLYDVGIMQCSKGLVAHNTASLFVKGRQIEGNCDPLKGEGRICTGIELKGCQRVGIFNTYFEEGSAYIENVLQFKMQLCKYTGVIVNVGPGCKAMDFHMNRWDGFKFNFDPEDYPALKFTMNHTHNIKFLDQLKADYPGSGDPEKFMFWGNFIAPPK